MENSKNKPTQIPPPTGLSEEDNVSEDK